MSGWTLLAVYVVAVVVFYAYLLWTAQPLPTELEREEFDLSPERPRITIRTIRPKMEHTPRHRAA